MWSLLPKDEHVSLGVMETAIRPYVASTVQQWLHWSLQRTTWISSWTTMMEKGLFITTEGLYRLLVMLSRLCNAPVTFEHMLDTPLQSCLQTHVTWTTFSFFSRSMHGHLWAKSSTASVQLAFSLTAKSASLTINDCALSAILWTKMVSIPILKESRPCEILLVPRMPNRYGLFSAFVFIHVSLSKALPKLLHLCKDTSSTWETDQQQSFLQLKSALSSPPILGHFWQDAHTEIHTYATGHGLGSVLIQT